MKSTTHEGNLIVGKASDWDKYKHLTKITGSLYLQDTKITSLPDNLTVGGSLDLRGTAITSLPDNLTVGGYLYLRGTAITKSPKTIKTPAPDFSITLKASIEVKLNLKGFSIADGILARILSSKGRTKKICIVGKKEQSYLITDGHGNFAHGKTIKEAQADLVYKVVAKFDGKLPKSATGKEWIGIYRAVTGACGTGVRNFVEQTGKSLDDTYTAKEIAKLVQGKFGADKFAEKLKAA